MALAADYKLGPHTFPRGWFIVAEANELDAGPKAVRFFGNDFALYRGESGRVVMLDAYCAHMGTHIAASKSAEIVATDKQIEGDSIRCPYHGWRYAPDGQVDDIPYHDGPCPKSAAIKSYEVREVMGCIMMWHDPEGNAPSYDPPFLTEWDDPAWVRWELDHLGTIDIHPQEILDNMADCAHLGPTHGAPCEYFENEFRNHVVIQRQGGFHHTYGCYLSSITWYTGPGILLSKQDFGGAITYELIANTPVEDGVTRVWHAALAKAQNIPHSAEDIAAAKEVQAGALHAFSADFDVWKHKRPAIRIMQLKADGPFNLNRKWYKQFYDALDNSTIYTDESNGIHQIPNFPAPSKDVQYLEEGLKL
ncbi:MAG: (2Fe-2S)-binding protein [Cellvibrionales bacterium]|jgi:3-ketosteroid 9alpha-monooxygenase subunit A|nr:(2Fe-2S)-binding protein [Cellvibrionales bacterium]